MKSLIRNKGPLRKAMRRRVTVGAITSYNLRNKDDFDQFDLHSEKFRKSLLPDCVRKWNSLDKQKRSEGSCNMPSSGAYKLAFAIAELYQE